MAVSSDESARAAPNSPVPSVLSSSTTSTPPANAADETIDVAAADVAVEGDVAVSRRWVGGTSSGGMDGRSGQKQPRDCCCETAIRRPSSMMHLHAR